MSTIKVTADELRQLAGSIQQGAGNIQGESDRLLKQVQGLVGQGWEGAASQSFNDLFAKWNSSATQLQQALDGIHKLLAGAADTYDQTEAAIAKSMGG